MVMLRPAALRHCSISITRRNCLRCRNQQSRSFFGLGQILGVIAQPAETLRQLNESRELLKKAKEDFELSNEAKKIPKKHTFSKLPGFHGRKAEQLLLRKILSNAPKMNVIFGATSVGKTALLREVLATDDFYVINFDLRISGFADLRSLYLALCEQFERFFERMEDEEMDKQKLVFKHLVIDLLEKEKTENGYEVSVADIAGLMESLQSCFLKYWEYEPVMKPGHQDDADGGSTGPVEEPKARVIDVTNPQPRRPGRITGNDDRNEQTDEKPRFRKKPIVFFMDEAHKLPALVDNPLSLKVFLDTLLVLTKQDRLCHVILATSDAFFQHFLRSMNVGHHAQLLTVGDCSKEETHAYFQDRLEMIPTQLRAQLDFDEIFSAFGGKLSHISDYLGAWVDAEGQITPYTSAIFIQAYTLLQFHLTRAKFETFSPLSTATSGTSTEYDDARFSPDDLLYVMRKLVRPPFSAPYFMLCRELGTKQIDSMIKARILELRWTKTVTPEEDWIERQWSRDGIERPVVLPMTRVIRRAMEVVLKEQEQIEARK